MKNLAAVLLIPFLVFTLVSCVAAEDDCKTKIEEWDTFLGIPYGANELEIDNYLGKFSAGEYTEDSTAFVYYYRKVNRAPISVWVNAKTGKVETVFIEVLGLKDYFEEDVAAVKEEYEISDCDSKWFGKEPEEVIELLGKPAKDEITKDQSGKDVRSIFYETEDYRINVNFNFYQSQGGACSSIAVYWF
ncbi:MAG: hypothetical protein WDZ35_15000 [Crocinitomicaceae bacterium]